MNNHVILPSDLLHSERILLGIAAENKKRIFEEIGLAFENSGGPSRSKVFKQLLERERLGSTVIATGVAIPHARMTDLKVPMAAFARAQDTVVYDTPDNLIRHMFFLLAPDKADGTHLQILSLTSRLLTDTDFIAKADTCLDGTAFIGLVRDWETANNLLTEGQQTAAG